MSHRDHTVTIKGIVASGDNDKLVLLDIALNEKNWDDNIDEEDQPTARLWVDKLRALPKGDQVCTCMADPVTGHGPLAVGWFNEDSADATDEMVEALQKVLAEAGFETDPIDDEFETYG